MKREDIDQIVDRLHSLTNAITDMGAVPFMAGDVRVGCLTEGLIYIGSALYAVADAIRSIKDDPHGN